MNSNIQENHNSYILHVDDFGRERLKLQHQVYEEASTNFIKKMNFRPDMKVLEIGCGSGDMSLWFAKNLNNASQLTIIDLNEGQLNYTAQRLQDQGYQEFNMYNLNIYDLHNLTDKYDLIYSRMVLFHLDNHNFAIKNMINILNTKGMIITEDPVMKKNWFLFYPYSTVYNKFMKVVTECFAESNIDPQCAYKIPNLYRNNGLKNIYIENVQPLFKSEAEKLLLAMGLKDLAPRIEELGLLNDEEITKMYNELIALSKKTDILSWANLIQICATF